MGISWRLAGIRRLWLGSRPGRSRFGNDPFIFIFTILSPIVHLEYAMKGFLELSICLYNSQEFCISVLLLLVPQLFILSYSQAASSAYLYYDISV